MIWILGGLGWLALSASFFAGAWWHAVMSETDTDPHLCDRCGR